MNTPNLDTLDTGGAAGVPAELFVPEKVQLPISADLATELTSWVGSTIHVARAGGERVIGTLIAVLKGPGGELQLKIKSNIPSEHLVPWSKVLEIRRDK